ncbi:MAG: DNA-binding protein WhiA [Synergistaceae bacterium]|nr:DNA-binding protein WhiA [Synergistaceae bacterium]
MERLNRTIWDEWTSFPLVPPVEDEIAGIFDGLSYKKHVEDYYFTCSRLFAVRRLLRLWALSGFQDQNSDSSRGIRLIHTQQQRGRIVFSVSRGFAEEIFTRSARLGRRARNWNWVRGLWGSCGALYIPRAGYHLVLRPPEGNGSAERIQGILKSAGFSLGVRKKGGTREIMLRDQQQIVTFLSRLGFVQSALELEETAIYRSMRSHANKLVNCDAANINKSVQAAQNQMALIRQLEEYGIVEELPEGLRELIRARKSSPSISLKELGQSMPRPISKSTVEYRWRKLENILNKMLKGDGGHVLGKGRC